MQSTQRIPILGGADVELGNFIVGAPEGEDTTLRACRMLIAAIPGVHGASRYSSTAGTQPKFDPQDWNRKFLTNGGSAYIDMQHGELCIPEVRSAYDYVAWSCGMLRVARQAQINVNRWLADYGERLLLLHNNSDGRGRSYAAHLNFQLSRRAFDDTLSLKPHLMLYLAAYQVSSIVFTGQGKVGSENGQPPVDFQISQRADFFEQLCGYQTTFRRPLINTRDEPLVGSVSSTSLSSDLARLHVIFYDANHAQIASYLKFGVFQIILAMISAEQINRGLLLDEPVDAVVRWSHDISLSTRVRTWGGQDLNAVELQLLFFEAAQQFVEAGGCEGIVPDADTILRLWGDTLELLRGRQFDKLAGRLDWVLKHQVIQRAMAQRPSLRWDSPGAKHLDLIYSSLDPADGLYLAFERGGSVERIVSEADIEKAASEPPRDTRAWTRAMLLRTAGSDRIADVDWDFVKIRTGLYGSRTFHLPNPMGFTEADAHRWFDGDATIDEVFDAAGADSDSVYPSALPDSEIQSTSEMFQRSSAQDDLCS